MVFISYSRNDQEEVLPLLKHFQENGVEFWIDDLNIPVGQRFVRSVAEGLWQANNFILIDTPESRSSYWIKKEISVASRYFKKEHYNTLIRIYKNGFQDHPDNYWNLSIPFSDKAMAEIVSFLKQKGEPVPRHSLETMPLNKFLNRDLQIRGWVGRQANLQALDKWWAHGHPIGLQIRGLAYTGKTALAYTWISTLIHLILDTHEFSFFSIDTRDYISEKAEFENRLQEEIKESGFSPGIIYIEDSLRGAGLVWPILDKILRHPYGKRKRIIANTNEQLDPFLFDLHEINSKLKGSEYSYLDEYDIDKNIAFEIHKRISKHPESLAIFEKLPTDFKYKPWKIYEYLQFFDKTINEKK